MGLGSGLSLPFWVSLQGLNSKVSRMVGRRNPVQPDSNSQRAILPGKISSSGPQRTGNVGGGEGEDSCEGRSQMESFEDPTGRGTNAGALLLVPVTKLVRSQPWMEKVGKGACSQAACFTRAKALSLRSWTPLHPQRLTKNPCQPSPLGPSSLAVTQSMSLLTPRPSFHSQYLTKHCKCPKNKMS